jgi:hypothetical protein
MTHLQKILAYAATRAATLGLTGALALLTGCATIVGDDRASLPIKSTPSDAQILIIDETGQTAYRGRTPDQVSLSKSNGHYWGGKQFTVAISKRGYLTQRIQVDTRPNALYLGGNLIFGGIIGWLVVDPISGKMYDLASEGIDVTLQQRADEEVAAMPAPEITVTPLEEPAGTSRPLPSTPPAAAARPAESPAAPSVPTAPVTAGIAPLKPAPAATSNPASARKPAAASNFVPERAPGGERGSPVETGPAAPLASEPAPPAAAPPAEPRPYWPTPPALPVSPSTAAPRTSSLA